jgi:hypothetical protein
MVEVSNIAKGKKEQRKEGRRQGGREGGTVK